MRRPICWTTRLEDRTKREARVSLVGRSLAWAFKRTGDEHWNPAEAPTPEDWRILLATAERWYTRRALSHENLELIRRHHREAQALGQAE